MFDAYHRTLPVGVERGQIKMCFKNSFELAWNPKYRYCEGFGLISGLYPMHHAWCIDENGVVVDRTWDVEVEHIEYIGFVFDHAWVAGYSIKKKSYGILDWWQKGFPELREGWEGLNNLLPLVGLGGGTNETKQKEAPTSAYRPAARAAELG